MTQSPSHPFDFDEIALDAAVSTTLLTMTFFGVRNKVGTNPKRVGWILSFACAVIMSVVGFAAALRTNIAEDGWEQDRILSSNSRSGRFLATFIFTYMLQDIVTSRIHYPDEMELLTGWLHHVFYMIISYAALKYHFSDLFCVFSVMEWSSIVLAIGHVEPRYRSDLGFGITFFVVRILYFGYAVYQLSHFAKLLTFIGCMPLLVHCYWFYRWCRSYYRKRQKLKPT